MKRKSRVTCKEKLFYVCYCWYAFSNASFPLDFFFSLNQNQKKENIYTDLKKKCQNIVLVKVN